MTTGISSTALRRLATGQLPVRDLRGRSSDVGETVFGKIVLSLRDRLTFDAGPAYLFTSRLPPTVHPAPR
ncbi:hypothetical protein GCM10010276_30510 [Streptomyces longisporus]|uniref:Uncharacterized protein n=1 Tax=Streptomyces longisporus TaxID=1948 RepID=A0ABP5Z4N1_STRLO